MWHWLTLTAQEIARGAEIEILDLVDAGIQDNRRASMEFLTRATGYPGGVPYEQIPVEIRSTRFSGHDTKVIYMNDTALEIYRQRGGSRQIEKSVEALPEDANLVLMTQIIFHFHRS